MPTYLRKILASVFEAAVPRIRAVMGNHAVHWVGLSVGYVAVFACYVAILIALFTPELAVAVARVMLVAAVLAGIVGLAVVFGRLTHRCAPAAEAAHR